MTISITIPKAALKQLNAKSDKVADNIRKELERGLIASGNTVRNEIIDSFNRPKTGKSYVRGGKVHVASAPKEPPAVDTGDLRNSIEMFPDLANLTVDISPDGSKQLELKKAVALEFGTMEMQSPPYMQPRPYMRPAAKKTSKKVRAILTKAVKNGANKNV